jgi:hypothetical protein
VRWPRDDWSDALWLSEQLKPLERLVGLAYAKRAGAGDVAGVGMDDLLQLTGLSRNAARSAVRGLVSAGWLLLVERERQQRATRYRLTYPGPPGVISAPPQGVSSGPAGFSGGHEVPPSGGHEETPGGHLVTPGGPELTPYLSHDSKPPLEPADALWLVVVDTLPEQLAMSLTRTQRLDDAMRRLVADGWTPEALADRTRARPWINAQPGAVVAWLSNLPPAGTQRAPAQIRRRCPVYGHEHSPVTAAGVCSSCRAEQLGATA